MPNAAALNIFPSIRPPLPKTDFAPYDPRAPDFAGLLDASTQPPPKDPSPPRNDDARSPPPRRADTANDDPATNRTTDKPDRGADNSSGSTDDAASQQRDAAPADPSKAPPEKAAKAGSPADKANSDKKTADDKAAEENQAADAIAANVATDAKNVAPSQPADAAAIVAAAVPVTVAASDGSTVPASTLPTGIASVDAATGVTAVEPTAIGTTPALVIGAATTAEKTETKAGVADAVPSDTETTGVENFSEATAKNQQTAPKTPATAATAKNEKAPEKAKTDDAHLQVPETDGATQQASDDQQVSELTKSSHTTETKTPSVERAAAAKSDSKPTADATAVANNTPANNQPATTPVAFGATALSADGTPISDAAPRASTSDSATVPIAGLAVEIATRAKDGNKSFDIRLDPPELGRIHVRLDIDSKGNVTSHLLVDRADTYDLLRRDFSGLERALNDAGLKTGDNSLQFTMRDQGFAGDQQRGNQFTHSSRVVVPGEVDAPAGAPRYMLPRLGGVDIRV
ncbi:MAG: flagellar hook-length control protein FliK [Xanthobacteraceae bacterium]